MKFIPLLVKPRLWGLRNYISQSIRTPRLLGRDLVLLAIGMGLMSAIYFGGRWSLIQFESYMNLAYLDPGTVLGLIFLFLQGMLIFSSGAHAYGAFYQSKDLELICASPMSRMSFFIGRFVEVYLFTCWIVILMLLPVVLVFGRHYHAPLTYYVVSLALLGPFCVIPVACGIVIATLIAYLIPPHRTRYVALFVLCAVLAGIGYLLHFVATVKVGTNNTLAILLRIVQLLSVPNRDWMPSMWLGQAMNSWLVNSSQNYWTCVFLVLSSAVMCLSLAFLFIILLHPRIYLGHYADNRVVTGSRRIRLYNYLPEKIMLEVVLFEKELKTTMRNSMQMLHVLLFVGICSMYLYFLSIEQQIEANFPADKANYWRVFLILMNFAVEAFVIIAICTRFVFPTVSLEGKSFWVLRVVPVSLKRILAAKITTWSIVIGVVTSLMFATANYVLYGSILLAVGKFALNFAVSVGLVTLAVCSGALFAEFDWEHESQLAASFGSIVFMVVALFFAGIMMFIAWIITYILTSTELIRDDYLKGLFSVAMICMIWIINLRMIAPLIRVGERSLLGREH